MAIRTELEVDLLECSAPVDGQYPLQFVSIESAGADEKLGFPAGTEGAQREINILLGSNIQAGRLIVGVTRSLPGNWTSWLPHEHAAILEEIYVYVDMPAPAFGLQLAYTDENQSSGDRGGSRRGRGVVARGLPSQCFDSRLIPELRLDHGGPPRSRRSQVGSGRPSLWLNR